MLKGTGQSPDEEIRRATSGRGPPSRGVTLWSVEVPGAPRCWGFTQAWPRVAPLPSLDNAGDTENSKHLSLLGLSGDQPTSRGHRPSPPENKRRSEVFSSLRNLRAFRELCARDGVKDKYWNKRRWWCGYQRGITRVSGALCARTRGAETDLCSFYGLIPPKPHVEALAPRRMAVGTQAFVEASQVAGIR